MKIIVAPDSYKESCSAKEVALAMKRGIHHVFPNAEVIKVPIADGGEGTIEMISQFLPGVFVSGDVMQANKSISSAKYLLLENNVAVIEVAQASGLAQMEKEERNPLEATSYGTGTLILKALDAGATKLIIGLGGSACNDGGAGMLQALGASLLDENREPISLGNRSLADLVTVDLSTLDKRLEHLSIDIVSDVENPLLGKKGASYIFGKQKGASKGELSLLDKNLAHFSEAVSVCNHTEKHLLLGSGAAGGIGFGLFQLSDNVTLYSGVTYLLELIDFPQYLINADLILTGEGATDEQTVFGKAPLGVAKMGKQHHVPTIIISGAVNGNLQALYDEGVISAHSVLHDVSTLEEAFKEASSNIEYVTESIIRTRFL